MAKVKVSGDFDASIDQVWALIKDFGNLSAWAPDANITKLEGEGIGAIRHLDTAVGHFKERCEAHDDSNYSFSYALLESSLPLPLKDYVATVKLKETGPRSCAIEWACVFEPVDVSEGEMIPIVEQTYAGFISAIKNALK